jgi:hypothetical protein
MKSIQLKSNVGHDGILRLQLPVDMPNQEIEIVIVIHAVQQKMKIQHINAQNGWPENFFQDVVGSWTGDLSRPQQGNFELTHNTNEFHRVDGLNVEDWQV